MHDFYLTYDIETSPLDWESLSESQQEYLLRGAANEEEIAKKKSEMALTPLTSRIVCLGMQLVQAEDNGSFNLIKRAAYSNSGTNNPESFEQVILPGGDDNFLCSEPRILEDFWKILKKYSNVHLITFNGRNFDAPFLMLRSALLKIKPSRNLMSGTKFNYTLHTDLLDELTFFSGSSYGATRRFNFDFYTRQFGLASPKAEGIDGSKVSEFYKAGRISEIAEYCLRDVKATWELFLIWQHYLKF